MAERRQLLAALIQRDFDARYAGSVLGVLWTQLYPLLLLGVYSFVFSTIFKNDIPNFPLFLFIGIAVWHFFSSAIQLATGSMLANAYLLTKVGFPRETLTISIVCVAFIDLVASHLVIGAGALVYGVQPAWSWLALPMIAILLGMQCVGLGLMLATAAVYLRDVRFVVEVAVLLLMFLSPVFYAEAAVPESLGWMLRVNPIAVAITAYRQAFLSATWPTPISWALLCSVAVVAVWLGLEIFDRGQRGFADAL